MLNGYRYWKNIRGAQNHAHTARQQTIKEAWTNTSHVCFYTAPLNSKRCYTNHALDQFLEGLLTFEDNVVRIGSRSKSEILKRHNIRQLMSDGIKVIFLPYSS